MTIHEFKIKGFNPVLFENNSDVLEAQNSCLLILNTDSISFNEKFYPTNDQVSFLRFELLDKIKQDMNVMVIIPKEADFLGSEVHKAIQEWVQIK